MNRMIWLAVAAATFTACKKESDQATPGSTAGTAYSDAALLADFTVHVAQANYNDLAQRTAALQQDVANFVASGSEDDLATCKQAWHDARHSWENSEGMLFGPVSTGNIDPRIDTWPVNFVDLDAQLTSGNAFAPDYIAGLEDALKGFHPIEYLLFGQDGNKSAAQFTDREREYLTALTNDVAQLTATLANAWAPGTTGNYSEALRTAGEGSTVYGTRLAAFEELVNAMAGICDEVANAKMLEPFQAQDPSLEESPFANSSISDFANNIRGIQNVYLGRYGNSDGVGLEDFVRQNNLQLDGQIKQQINAAIDALNAITVPFGEAITTHPVLVQQAMDAINTLAATLNDGLLPLVQQHVQ